MEDHVLPELRLIRRGRELAAVRTKEAIAKAARDFLEGARARAQGMGGHVVSGHGTGEPLAQVLLAFLLSDPRIEGWLVEQAGHFAELSDKQRDSRLRKLDAEIVAVTDELRELRKREAFEAVERESPGPDDVRRDALAGWRLGKPIGGVESIRPQ